MARRRTRCQGRRRDQRPAWHSERTRRYPRPGPGPLLARRAGEEESSPPGAFTAPRARPRANLAKGPLGARTATSRRRRLLLDVARPGSGARRGPRPRLPRRASRVESGLGPPPSAATEKRKRGYTVAACRRPDHPGDTPDSSYRLRSRCPAT